MKSTLPILRLLGKETGAIKAAEHLQHLHRLELWIYVAGRLIDYDDKSGPGRLATGRSPPRLLIDLNIAQRDYRDKPQEGLRQWIGDGVEACFELMLGRALRRKGIVDEVKLRSEFSAAMQRFRTGSIPPYVPLGTPQYL